MAESYRPDLDRIGGVEDMMATEDLAAVCTAFPHLAKATILSERANNYYDQIEDITKRIEDLQICPILRYKRWRLNFLFEALRAEAETEYLEGNSLLPPDKPFA